MCGRFTLTNPGAAIERYKMVKLVESRLPVPVPRWNVAPTQDVAVIVPPRPEEIPNPGAPAAGDDLPVLIGGPDDPQLVMARWGYEPAWLKGRGKPQINARAETLMERPMFRGALSGRRCAILADGFYEWQAPPGGGKKQPHHIRLKDGRPFGFAGIFTRAGDGRLTCAILTCEPNDLMSQIHHRMPVILRAEHEDLWLDPAEKDPIELLACLQPYPAEEMEAFPVSDAVNSSRSEGSQLALPLF
jgi:putative SOS response-associated peptidase YedK